eukprot:CAMPEP_0170188858 /NCGR_PEP_ID=MMETSP0040_2-20121228/45380_1 /TAXON_ID=641309 /ORGANISM="Lotharella oceanica, Strain CCMP622" /LENGTH=157 /DNA_ID=CAMNT_0010436261 /DNA_START=253 /DNA_END=727 /DNA_ORIENTATION=-
MPRGVGVLEAVVTYEQSLVVRLACAQVADVIQADHLVLVGAEARHVRQVAVMVAEVALLALGLSRGVEKHMRAFSVPGLTAAAAAALAFGAPSSFSSWVSMGSSVVTPAFMALRRRRDSSSKISFSSCITVASSLALALLLLLLRWFLVLLRLHSSA